VLENWSASSKHAQQFSQILALNKMQSSNQAITGSRHTVWKRPAMHSLRNGDFGGAEPIGHIAGPE
jgi:hypothetical protein